MGGRLYSQPSGANYQQMPREQRLQMTISGEPVCEIDIRASYLTIFHGWNGRRLAPSRDPYDLPGLGPEGRQAVKLWFVATFGNAHLKKWPREMAQEYRDETGRKLESEFPFALIREKALKAFPLLERWGQPGLDGRTRTWADLMYAESTAMMSAMLTLMRAHKVPSLCVHDSLIVPRSRQRLAEQLLRNGYRMFAGGQEPVLKAHAPSDRLEEAHGRLLGTEPAFRPNNDHVGKKTAHKPSPWDF